MRLKQQLVHYVFVVIFKSDADVGTDEVYHALISKTTLQMMKPRIIGQLNLDDDAMDIVVGGS